MAISWRLKTYLASKHEIFLATDLQKLILKKTGTMVSLSNLCRYCNKRPKSLRLETIQILCTTLGCSMDAFCEISPVVIKKSEIKKKKLSPQNTPNKNRGANAFPHPGDYES
jgi:hypothetical protein